MIQRILVAASAAALTLGLMPTASAAPPATSSARTAERAAAAAAGTADGTRGDAGGPDDTVLRLAEDGRPATYVVRLEDPAVAGYTGGIEGLAPTSPRAGEQLDTTSAPAQRYEEYLLTQQDDVVAAAQERIGRAPEVELRYTHALNGFATELSVEEARAVARLPGVAAVTVDQIRELQSDVGPEWIGAPALWGEATGVPGDVAGSLFQATARERVLGTPAGVGQPVGTRAMHRLDLGDATTPVPDGATAVALNVTVSRATEPTFVSVCPGGTSPASCSAESNVNAVPGADIAAQVIVALGRGDAADAVEIYNDAGAVSVFADVAGYFVSADATDTGTLLQPIVPTRAVDFQPIAAGELVTVDLDDVVSVPEGARAVAMNLTGTAVRGDTYVAACPGGTPVETCRDTSVLNLTTGRNTPNATILELSADNTVSFYSNGANIQLIGDAQGWFVDAVWGGSSYQPVEPQRIMDRARLGRRGTTTLDLDDVATVPAGTTAVALNVTATGGTQETFVAVCPGGTEITTCDDTSVLNPREREDRANMVVARVDPATRTVQFFNNVGDVQLIADLAGFFTEVPGGEVLRSGTQGEGVVAGIIDSGIVPENPSFADVVPVAKGGDGYDHSNPFGAGRYVGVCDPTSAVYRRDFPCNDKLIGAWDFTGDQRDGGRSPRDDNGHGTHTASTTAGNRLRAVTTSLEDPAFTATEVIKGVAPHANVIAYDVCGIPVDPPGPGPLNPGCSTSAIIGAINQAISDGVDVLNFSIGGGSSDPWTDPDALAFLAARTAGIFVATAAGNSGPGAQTVGSPGEAPWVTSVGATTHDRQWQSSVEDLTAAGGATLPDIHGLGFSSGTSGAFPLVYAGAPPYNNPLCVAERFAAGTSFDGRIVLCDRGTTGRVQKGAVVAALGAEGMILANDVASGDSRSADPHALPAANIGYADAVALKTWMGQVEGEQASISGGTRVRDPELADHQAGFSSRGPSLTAETLLPSLSAPGVDVLAANGTGDDVRWGFASGTSMASPHVAGAAALLTSARPDWSPAELESALMTTAVTAVTDTDGTPADWFDMGAGRVDLARAAQAGLVLDETRTGYVRADPRRGGESSDINVASMTSSACVVTCSWQRTVRATGTGVGTWSATAQSLTPGVGLTVTPATFTFDRPDQTQVVTVTADVSGAVLGSYSFGQLVLTPQSGSRAPVAHLPVSVRPTAAELAEELTIATTASSGTTTTGPIRTAFDVTDLQAEVSGLVLGTRTGLSIPADPTNDDPFNGDGVQTTFVTVPAGATRFVASLVAPTAPDFDLYVGTGTTPSRATIVCTSAAPGSDEECDVVPDPDDGTQYWVVVQNWEPSAAGTDTATLVTAVPVEDRGNLTIGEPVPAEPIRAGTPFTVPVTWSGITAPGRWYGTVTLGTDADNPDDIGTFAVTLDRSAGG